MRYTKEQIAAALLLFQATGSPGTVLKTLGYPSNPMLYKWRERYPEFCSTSTRRHYKQASADLKISVIRRCFTEGESVQLVSDEIGYTPSSIYGWYRRYKAKGSLSLMKKPDTKPSASKTSPDDLETIKAQMLDMQMEIDILKETINVLKKDPGVDQKALRNREKAVIIDALKHKYPLPKLRKKLHISKSSYYYQEKILRAEDKYLNLRKQITEFFHQNRDTYGYRRIYTLLRKAGQVVSEKIIRRIMKEEGLCVLKRRRRKYNSYKGEITPAVDNKVASDFHADKPNEKWLTDITEFPIRAGKIYLSPIIDCFDGMPVTWTIGTSPDAELVNTMIQNAISGLAPDEKPIIHSDRGCHYRWPEWIRIVTEAGLSRSMSKKGCSPDNSACEGFFGHLKIEMFYGHNWDDYSIPEFIAELNDYLEWYCQDRIKSTLGGMSPLEYRRRLGLAV